MTDQTPAPQETVTDVDPAAFHQAIQQGDAPKLAEYLAILCNPQEAIPVDPAEDPQQRAFFHDKFCTYIQQQAMRTAVQANQPEIVAMLVDPMRNVDAEGHELWHVPDHDVLYHQVFIEAPQWDKPDLLRTVMDIRSPSVYNLKWGFFTAVCSHTLPGFEGVMDDIISHYDDPWLRKTYRTAIQDVNELMSTWNEDFRAGNPKLMAYFSTCDDPDIAMLGLHRAIDADDRNMVGFLTTLVRPDHLHVAALHAINQNNPDLARDFYHEIATGDGYPARNPWPEFSIPFQDVPATLQSLLMEAINAPDKKPLLAMLDIADPEQTLGTLQECVAQDRPRTISTVLDFLARKTESMDYVTAEPWRDVGIAGFIFALRHGNDEAIAPFITHQVPMNPHHLAVAAGRGKPYLLEHVLDLLEDQSFLDEDSFTGNWLESQPVQHYASTLSEGMALAMPTASAGMMRIFYDRTPQPVRDQYSLDFLGEIMVVAARDDDTDFVKNVLREVIEPPTQCVMEALRYACRYQNKPVFDVLVPFSDRDTGLMQIAHEMAEMQSGDPKVDETVCWILEQIPSPAMDDLVSLAHCAHEQHQPPVYLKPVLTQVAQQSTARIDGLFSDMLSQRTTFHTPEDLNSFADIYLEAGASKMVLSLFRAIEQNDPLAFDRWAKRLPETDHKPELLVNAGHRAIIDGQSHFLPKLLARLPDEAHVGALVETARMMEDQQVLDMLQPPSPRLASAPYRMRPR